MNTIWSTYIQNIGTLYFSRSLKLDAGQELWRNPFSEVEKLKRLVNAKYDKSILLYDQGIKQWDKNLSVTMVVRGEK